MDKPRMFKVHGNDIKEVIPEALFMKHMFGDDMSIALFKFAKDKGQPLVIDVSARPGNEVWEIFTRNR